MQIGVRGTWRLGAHQSMFSGLRDDDYEAALIEQANRWQWFRKPERRLDKLIIRTLAKQGSLLKSSRFEISGIGAGAGNIWISLTCNPTETLANRIAFFQMEASQVNAEHFLAHISEMSPRAFFSRHGVRPSLDGRENWIPDYDLATHLLGHDPFLTFMPIFFRKLMALVAQIVAPFGSRMTHSEDGTDETFQMEGFAGSLHWGSATVPQIETYIERHHQDASLAVRSAAQIMLASLDEARVRQHLHRISFERYVDLFSIRSEIPGERDLSVYAKSPTRLRFEVSRPKRGRYEPQLLQVPIDRLVQIFRSERSEFIDCCDWSTVADFLVPPPTPWMGDFVEMLVIISQVCAEAGLSPRPVIVAMLSNAGASIIPDAEVPSSVIARLQARGVLERVTLRNRDRSGPRRLVLTPMYREIFHLLLTTFESERASG